MPIQAKFIVLDSTRQASCWAHVARMENFLFGTLRKQRNLWPRLMFHLLWPMKLNGQERKISFLLRLLAHNFKLMMQKHSNSYTQTLWLQMLMNQSAKLLKLISDKLITEYLLGLIEEQSPGIKSITESSRKLLNGFHTLIQSEESIFIQLRKHFWVQVETDQLKSGMLLKTEFSQVFLVIWLNTSKTFQAQAS